METCWRAVGNYDFASHSSWLLKAIRGIEELRPRRSIYPPPHRVQERQGALPTLPLINTIFSV